MAMAVVCLYGGRWLMTLLKSAVWWPQSCSKEEGGLGDGTHNGLCRHMAEPHHTMSLRQISEKTFELARTRDFGVLAKYWTSCVQNGDSWLQLTHRTDHCIVVHCILVLSDLFTRCRFDIVIKYHSSCDGPNPKNGPKPEIGSKWHKPKIAQKWPKVGHKVAYRFPEGDRVGLWNPRGSTGTLDDV